MAGKLVHFEIAAADDGRAMDFYKQVFGWQFQDAGMPGGAYNLTEAGGEPGGAGSAFGSAFPRRFRHQRLPSRARARSSRCLADRHLA